MPVNRLEPFSGHLPFAIYENFVMSDRAHLPLTLTNKMTVILGNVGVEMLTPRSAPPLPLKYYELLTLCELEAEEYVDEALLAETVAKIANVKSEQVDAFRRSLVRHGRLRRRHIPIPKRGPHNGAAETRWPVPDFYQHLVALKVPAAVRISDRNLQLLDHDGQLVISLTPAELFAVAVFSRPTTLEEGIQQHQTQIGDHAINQGRLVEILSQLAAIGLVSTIQKPANEKGVAVLDQITPFQILKENFAKQAREQDQREAERRAKTGVYRHKVIPVAFGQAIPAALGLVVAAAKVYEDGVLDDFYDIRLDWVWDDDRLEDLTSKPAVYLFSNYLWSHEMSINVSECVKRRSPDSITIHGGPDTPKYEQDAHAYFEKFPHVDIVVRGEGEASAAETLDKLRPVIGQENPDLTVLKDVQGITYKYKGEIFRNADRPRIVDINSVPSPYLMGLFDAFEGVPSLHATLETNRGCPYGCTFCDWGSATTSKIRKFDLDRVFGELEWCSRMKVQSVSQADANFGVFERDVAISECVARLKQSTGYPETFGGSYAKNSTKYLQSIIKILADAGILAQGVLSLQTMDDNTLAAINRSNIKVAKYDALANEMRNSNLQLTVELMMGLPGATVDSFIEDLQQCIDRDIQARINHTTMLVNSPMNNPDYRAEHQIETGTELGPGKMPVLVSTKTYTRDDMDLMYNYRQLYILLDNFGIMRLISRFVHQQTGMTEMGFYGQLLEKTGQDSQQHLWPLLNTFVNHGQDLMAAPYSWRLLFDELREFLIQECGISEDSALDTALDAQHALLPSFGRQYPFTLELEHDVVAWHSRVLAVKSSGHRRDWPMIVPPLSSFEPGTLEVEDVDGAVTKLIGCDLEISAVGTNWDMKSGISRARVDLEFHAGALLEGSGAQAV